MFEEEVEYFPISSNHLSFEIQLFDSLEFLKLAYPDKYREVLKQFPEIEHAIWDDLWLDNVDPDYSSWLADAIEATDLITWIDGEPFAISLSTILND